MLCDRAVVVCAVLGLIARVYAQSTATVCTGPSTTISSNADATKLASCQIYKGDVIIAKNMTGTVSLNGVQQITGSLSCKNVTNLTSLAATSLRSVDGAFDLENLWALSSLEFPLLTTVGTGFNINKTSNLTTITGFPKLSTINGSLHLGGAFNSIDLHMKSVLGDAALVTTSTNQSLCTLVMAASRTRIRGAVQCSLNNASSLADTPRSTDSTDPTKSDRSNHGLGAGKITGIVIGAVFGALLIAGLILWLCHFRPKKQQQQGPVFTKTKQDPNEVVEGGEVTEYYTSKPAMAATSTTAVPSERAYEPYQYNHPAPAVNQTLNPAPASAPPVPSGLHAHPTSFSTYTHYQPSSGPPSPPSPIDREAPHHSTTQHPIYPASSRYSDDFSTTQNMYDPPMPRHGAGFERTTSPRTDMMGYQHQSGFGPAYAEGVGAERRAEGDAMLGKSTVSPVPSILRPGRMSQGRMTGQGRTMREI